MKYSYGMQSFGLATIFKGNYLKKVVPVLALLVLGSAVWAQTLSIPDKTMAFTDDPTSVVNGSYRFSTDIDNFMGVTDWSGVEYNNWFFFLGGTTSVRNGTVNGGLQGGLATKIGGNHLGVYYNGNFFNGDGTNNGADDESQKNIQGKHYWNDSLSIVFGNETIGGIRFNLLFGEADFSSFETGSDTSGANVLSSIGFPPSQTDFTSSRAVTTSLQWGRAFGDFTPAITVGFRWPDKFEYKNTNIEINAWDHAQIGFKLEASYKDFSADYQFGIDLGPSAEYSTTGVSGEYSKSGYFTNDINLKYAFTWDVEKLQIKLRPQLQFRFYNESVTTKMTGTGQSDSEVNTQPVGYFWFDPIVQLGAKYAFSEKVNIYTGVKASFVGLTYKYTSTYKPQSDAAEEKDTPSAWDVAGIRMGMGNLALQINPSKTLSIEIGLDDMVHLESGTWKFDINNIGGGLAVILKP